MPGNLSVIYGKDLLPRLRRIQQDTLWFLLDTVRDYGDLVHFSLGGIHAYLVNHPDDIKHILQDNARNYTKNTIQYNSLATITGRGLLTNDGDSWLRNRRLAQPAFARSRLMRLDQVVVPACQRMLDQWETAAAAGAELDIDREMMRLTLEVVGKVLFGMDLSSEAGPLTEAVVTCLDHIVYQARTMITPPAWVPTPRNLRFKRALKRLDQAVAGLIRQRSESGIIGDDLLGMLLSARDEISGEGLTPSEIRDEVITLLIAGHETVASALTWTWYLLAQHPQERAALEAEVDSSLSGRAPSSADLDSLPRVAAVFNEALRLYPPAWLITRRSLEADPLPGGTIRPDSLVIISPYVVQRHTDFWPQPGDFLPGRFLGENEKQHRFAYIPFGGGPRLCIGNQFALIEGQLILACVSQRFRLENATENAVEVDPLVTLRPRRGLPMRLVRR